MSEGRLIIDGFDVSGERVAMLLALDIRVCDRIRCDEAVGLTGAPPMCRVVVADDDDDAAAAATTLAVKYSVMAVISDVTRRVNSGGGGGTASTIASVNSKLADSSIPDGILVLDGSTSLLPPPPPSTTTLVFAGVGGG